MKYRYSRKQIAELHRKNVWRAVDDCDGFIDDLLDHAVEKRTLRQIAEDIYNDTLRSTIPPPTKPQKIEGGKNI